MLTETNCPWQNIPKASLISGNTASNASFSQAKDWLEECLDNHVECRNGGHRTVPTRLLDLRDVMVVNPDRADGHVKLINTAQCMEEGVMKPDCKYACLSHCWGKVPIITTTSKTISDMTRGISFDSFPKTFQHAIITTLKLDVLYLWIDSLCIIQDSTSDWEHESKLMANVYNDAVFTVAASRATGAADGCFSQPTARYRGEEVIAYLEDGTTCPVWIRRPIDHNVWPLLKRGWVFQERLLSRRIIHFSNEEIVWECMERLTCQCSHVTSSWPASNNIDSKAQHHMSLTSNSSSNLTDRWRDMVCSYTAMRLTYEKDIFPALSGLAKTIHTRIRQDYCAGMWHDSLLIDMLWRLSNSINFSETRPQVWRAPSWSWASVVGKVTYDTMGGRALVVSAIKKLHAQLKSVEVQKCGTDEHGEVASGSVALQGFIVKAEAYFNGIYPHYPHLRIGEKERISPEWDDPVIEGKFSPGLDLDSGVYLLKMATTTSKGTNGDDLEEELVCLVLRCIDEGTNKFSRLGYLSRYWPEKDQWFKEAKKTTIIVV
jgi:hypothetical protein